LRKRTPKGTRRFRSLPLSFSHTNTKHKTQTNVNTHINSVFSLGLFFRSFSLFSIFEHSTHPLTYTRTLMHTTSLTVCFSPLATLLIHTHIYTRTFTHAHTFTRAYPPAPMNQVKIFKGWPPRDAPSKLVQLWYKSFPSDHRGVVEMKTPTSLSNKTSTA